MALGLAMVVLLAGRSMVKALLATLVGLWLAGIGTDLFSRLRASPSADGAAPASTSWWSRSGLFAIGDVLGHMEKREAAQALTVPKDGGTVLPMQDLRDRASPSSNGSVGLHRRAAGAGSTVASFLSYGLEKAVSRRPEQFGKGVVEGVAAPEAANNAETGGALIPMLTLGIPAPRPPPSCSPPWCCGDSPGPLFIPENPAMFWGWSRACTWVT